MELGNQIKARRMALELTLEELGERAGVSRAMLSDIERGTKNPSIKLVCQIAEGLGCTVSQLLGEEVPKNTIEKIKVVRSEERQALVDPRSGVERYSLSPGFLRRGIEVIWYVIPPGQSTGLFPPHQPGVEEHLTLVGGQLECYLGGERIDLQAGDSLSFQASLPHEFRNPGPQSSRYFLIINSSANTQSR